ncbi:concanavalin A-like lectin/glucanase domain-containing protein [Naematelia encephala]|uniref:Concanavalin A-like lectin/glucanase domain-containing protein n=1 Tax=Naematelia encephala TaxID=71784 RepID=A0A1Y2AM44_9TREE|nr:concanavalin A-like lectin/glucanase domain-containing protein [Naematelia encephala]
MHISNLLLPAVLLGTTVSARVPVHGARRAAHPARAGNFEQIKREPVVETPTKKDKRLVRKKKRGSCQVHYNVTSSASSVAQTSTTAIGGGAWANPSASSSTESWVTASVSSSEAWATASASSSATWAASSSAAAHSTTASSAAASASASSSSSWYLTDTWSGNSFFDNWNFWSYDDPTHGTVQYVDSGTAWNDGLVSISDGHAIMKVDTTETVSSARKSVRIHGNKVWTGGLVLMDAYHMPTGCATWPAWWQNGPNWPYGGEIDILEGVNAFTENQVSLHTGSGCTMPSDINDNMIGQLTTGSFNSYDCASYDTSNQGCGVRDATSDSSYGTSFNSANGGVYAMMWAKNGITVWHFPRSSIPDDITNDAPNPDGWGTPMARFPSDDCSPYEFFYDHYNIFDTTLCGDWAGADSVWNYAGYAGQDQSCASITGYSTCSDYVLNSGSSFSDAYWEIGYVKYFNSTTLV